MTRRIIVLHPAGLGDATMDLGLLRSIVEKAPDASLTWVTSAHGGPLLRAAGLEEFVRALSVPKGIRGAAKLLANAGRRPEVLLIPGGMNLRRLSPLIRLIRPERVGGALPDYPDECVTAVRPPEGVYDVIVGPEPGWHRVAVDSRLAQKLNVASHTRPPRLAAQGPRETGLAIVHHGAASLDSNKRLQPHEWAPLLQVLKDRFADVWLVGGALEVADSAAMAAGVRGVKDLTGKLDLPELITHLASAAIVVGPDSGPGHVAAAAATPTLSVFGPTRPSQCAPVGASSWVLFRPVPCGPCYWTKRYRNCPHDHRCMANLPVSIFEHAVEIAVGAERLRNGRSDDEVGAGWVLARGPRDGHYVQTPRYALRESTDASGAREGG